MSLGVAVVVVAVEVLGDGLFLMNCAIRFFIPTLASSFAFFFFGLSFFALLCGTDFGVLVVGFALATFFLSLLTVFFFFFLVELVLSGVDSFVAFLFCPPVDDFDFDDS